MELKDLSPLTIQYLNAKTGRDLNDLPLGVDHYYKEYEKALEYLRTCPLDQIPLYINNPSVGISEIVKMRLGGTDAESI